MKNLLNKYKMLLILAGAIFITIISVIFMFNEFKNSKKVTEENTNKIDVDLTQFEDSESQVKDVIEYNIENKSAISGCKILSKYSEDYISVMQWMLETICNEMNSNGFTVIEFQSLPNGDEDMIEVDGLEKYGNAEAYITEFFNNNPDADISDLLLTYCPDEYYALNNTYILGKDSSTEYGEAESQQLYNTLLSYYCEGKYSEIKTEIEELIQSYKLTLPYNYKLCNLYQDAKAMITYDLNTDAILYGLSYMHSPETYFENFLKLTNNQKADLIVDASSNVPFADSYGIFTERTYIEDTATYESKYSNYFTEDTKVLKINFYILKERNSFEAILFCNEKTNEYQVISIHYTGEGNCMYKTVNEVRGLNSGTSNKDTEIPETETIDTQETETSNSDGTEDMSYMDENDMESIENIE